MSEELRTALASALDAAVVAFLAVLTPTLVIIARRVGEWLKGQAIRVAVDAGVASAEELAHQAPDLTGAGKLEHAKQVARSIAPKALAKVDDQQLGQLVNGGVARLRPSLATAALLSSYPPGMMAPSLSSAPATSMTSATSGTHDPVRIVELPPPAALPRFEDRPTPAERPLPRKP